MTKEQKEELKKLTPRSVAYVYLHGCYSYELGLSFSAVLSLKGNLYYNKAAFEIASKIMRGKDNTL